MFNENDNKLSVNDIKRNIELLGACALDYLSGNIYNGKVPHGEKLLEKWEKEDNKEFNDNWNKENNPEQYTKDHPIKSAINNIFKKKDDNRGM